MGKNFGFFGSIWEWFDGNKTQLGALILALVAFEGDLLGQEWLETFLVWFGGVLGVLGVGHKLIKGVNNS